MREKPDEEARTGPRPSARARSWVSNWTASTRAKAATDRQVASERIRVPGNAAIAVVLELENTNTLEAVAAGAGVVLYGVIDGGARLPLAVGYALAPLGVRARTALVITTNGVTFDYYELDLATDGNCRARVSIAASEASGGSFVRTEHDAIESPFGDDPADQPLGFPTTPLPCFDTIGGYSPSDARATAKALPRARKLYGFGLELAATAAASRWIYIFDAAALPANGALSIHPPIPIDPGGYVPFDKGDCPIPLRLGCVVAISTTESTYTAAGAEAFISIDWRA